MHNYQGLAVKKTQNFGCSEKTNRFFFGMDGNQKCHLFSKRGKKRICSPTIHSHFGGLARLRAAFAPESELDLQKHIELDPPCTEQRYHCAVFVHISATHNTYSHDLIAKQNHEYHSTCSQRFIAKRKEAQKQYSSNQPCPTSNVCVCS